MWKSCSFIYLIFWTIWLIDYLVIVFVKTKSYLYRVTLNYFPHGVLRASEQIKFKQQSFPLLNVSNAIYLKIFITVKSCYSFISKLAFFVDPYYHLLSFKYIFEIIDLVGPWGTMVFNYSISPKNESCSYRFDHKT